MTQNAPGTFTKSLPLLHPICHIMVPSNGSHEDRLMRNSFVSFTCLFLMAMTPCRIDAETGPQIIPIPRDVWPALVYVEDQMVDVESRKTINILKAATFVDGRVERWTVIGAQSVQATQLDDAVFMVRASQYGEDPTQWTQAFYLVDFETGRSVMLSQSRSRAKLVHLICLRSDPDAGAAVLLRYGQGTQKDTLLIVDLRSLEPRELCSIPRTDPSQYFQLVHAKLSPGYKRLAMMVANDTREYGNNHDYRHYSRPVWSLQVLDLTTSRTSVLDDNVMVTVSPVSSCGPGPPPFEWISPTEILYQHMILDDPAENDETTETQALLLWDPVPRLLKYVNVTNGTTGEWFRNDMALTTSGGFVGRNWFTDAIAWSNASEYEFGLKGSLEYTKYDNGFGVDVEHRSLIEIKPCFAITKRQDISEVRFHGKVLAEIPGKSSHTRGCVSPSKANLAWHLHCISPETDQGVFAKTGNLRQAVRVSETSCSAELVAWIEDTTPLRNKPNR